MLPSRGSIGTESGHSLPSFLRQSLLFIFNQGLTEEHKPAAVTGQEVREWTVRIIHIVVDSAAVDTEVPCGLPGRIQLFGSYVRFFVSGFHFTEFM